MSAESSTAILAFGARAPGRLDRAMIAITSRMPNNWLGLKLAMAFRKVVTLRLRSGGALDVERWGLRMRLYPLDNGCEKNLLFTPQMYETVERAELAADIAHVNAEGRAFIFVDIGANVGLFSMYVASAAGGHAQIFAIEPEPGNMARFEFNLHANPSLPVRTYAVALGEEEGEVAVVLHPRDRGGTRTRDPTNASDNAVRVPCHPLLAFLRGEKITAIDALKIDVEGAEDKVLVPFFRDAPESLWPAMIVIEDSRHEWASDLFALLSAKGYVETVRSKQNVILRRAV